MLPASAPATRATSPSKLFHAIVKYSNCFPRRVTACRSSAISITRAYQESVDREFRIWHCRTSGSDSDGKAIAHSSVGSSLLLRRFRPQRAVPQCPFLHQYKEHRNQNQYVNRGRNHSADHGSGNRFHHVRANTACPEDGNQAGENGTDRHQLWPEPMHSTLNGGLVNIGICERAT